MLVLATHKETPIIQIIKKYVFTKITKLEIGGVYKHQPSFHHSIMSSWHDISQSNHHSGYCTSGNDFVVFNFMGRAKKTKLKTTNLISKYSFFSNLPPCYGHRHLRRLRNHLIQLPLWDASMKKARWGLLWAIQTWIKYTFTTVYDVNKVWQMINKTI